MAYDETRSEMDTPTAQERDKVGAAQPAKGGTPQQAPISDDGGGRQRQSSQ